MRQTLLLAALAVVMSMPACTTQQLYATGRGWQRSECAQKLDQSEYDRCMRDANIPYDSYKRETAPEKK
jgi:hypothetical protein